MKKTNSKTNAKQTSHGAQDKAQSTKSCGKERQGLRLMKRKKALQRGAKMRSEEDSLGSYTGVCTEDEHETPVQDADDL